MTTGLPWITSKLAVSLDGKTALASGESQWITSNESRLDVHRFRAASSAILTGIGTVLFDDPMLNARVDFDCVQPIPVILDSKLQLPLSARILQDNRQPWIITCSQDQAKHQKLQEAGCKIAQVADENGRPNLTEVFQLLASQQINTVWVEAGATLNGALLNSKLVDEWLIYQAPCVLGHQGLDMFNLSNITSMTEKKQLNFVNLRQIGKDIRLTFRT